MNRKYFMTMNNPENLTRSKTENVEKLERLKC